MAGGPPLLRTYVRCEVLFLPEVLPSGLIIILLLSSSAPVAAAAPDGFVEPYNSVQTRSCSV